MSSFNETIPFRRAQFRTDAVGATAAMLAFAKDEKAAKGVHIKNCHATNQLYIGRSDVTANNGYQLLPGDEIVLEVDNPSEIYVVASGASTTYSWFAY